MTGGEEAEGQRREGTGGGSAKAAALPDVGHSGWSVAAADEGRRGRGFVWKGRHDAREEAW